MQQKESQNMNNSLVVLQKHIVVEAIFNRWTVAEAASVHSLHGFSEDVGAGMPVNLQVFITKLEAKM